MSHRLLISIAVVPAVLVLLLVQPRAAGQTSPTTRKSATSNVWKPARTADGQPDLQGYWTNNTITPLERPKGLGAKEFYTEAELTELMKHEQNRVALNEEEGRPTTPGTDDDVHYDFSQFGLDRGQAKLSWNRRTSLIVGPEGTIPPMLPEARKRNAEIAAKNRGHEFDSYLNRPLSERCIVMNGSGIPMLPGANEGNLLQIVQGPGYLTLLHET